MRVPAQAKTVHFDDHGHDVSDGSTTAGAPRVPSSATRSSVSEPEPTEDRSSAGTHVEQGDDHGGGSANSTPARDETSSAEPTEDVPSSDDHGTDAPEPTASTTPDDHGSGGGHGGSSAPTSSEDGSSHGGR